MTTDTNERLVATSVKLTPTELRALELMAVDESYCTGKLVSRSTLLRRALREMIGAYEQRKAAAVGAA